MFKPCDHCEKADKRSDYLKCDNPCSNAKQCYQNDKKLSEVLRGYMPRIEKALERMNK